MKILIPAVALLAVILLAVPVVAASYTANVAVKYGAKANDFVTASDVRYVALYKSDGTFLNMNKTGKNDVNFTGLGSDKYYVKVRAKGYNLVSKGSFVVNDHDVGYIVNMTADKNAPSSSLSLSGTAGLNGWYTGDVTATVTSTDGGSGVEHIYASADQNSNTKPAALYSSPIVISTESGGNYVHYFATDYAENAEAAQHSSVIKLDKTVPSVNGLAAKTEANGNAITASTWQSDNTPYFYWTASDLTSGLYGYSFALDKNADNSVDTMNQYYTYGVNGTSLSDGKHVFHVKAMDWAGQWGSEVTFDIWVDAGKPSIGNFTESPASPATYSPGKSYSFGADVSDLDISDVIFMFNGVNYTYKNAQLTKSGNTFSASITDLAAGDYGYKWYAEDSAGNSQVSAQKSYTVNKAQATMKLYLDGAEWTKEERRSYAQAVTINATGSVPAIQSSMVLKRDSVAVSNPDVTNSLVTGSYVYSASLPVHENYTAQDVTQTLRIGKADNPVALELNGQSANVSVVYGTCVNVTGSSASGSLKLERDGADVTSELGKDRCDLDVGKYAYRLTASGDDNYLANDTGIAYYLTVTQADNPVKLFINGAEGNADVTDVTDVNVTGSGAGTLVLKRNGTDVSSELDVNVRLDPGAYLYVLTASGDKNRKANSTGVSYVVSVSDATPPVITVVSPGNITYQIDSVSVSITANEDLSSATVSLDGGAASALTVSGKTASGSLSGLGEGSHSVKITAVDLSSNSGSAAVRFTVPPLSRIVNSTIDGTYYADSRLNIHTGTSTITHSDITDSTVINSTVIDSTVKAKIIRNVIIEGSNVDPADFEGTTFKYANITENDSNFIRYSTVSYSNVFYSDIEYSTITNMTVGYANISHDYMYTGWLFYGGKNYTVPTNLANLLAGPDTVAPIIEPLTVSNSTPAPGDMVSFKAVVHDNVAVYDVNLSNMTAVGWDGAYSWTLGLNIPAANGTYEYFVAASDYAGNMRTRKIMVTVDTSADPPVIIAIEPVPCELLGTCPQPPSGGGGGGAGTGFSTLTILTNRMELAAPSEIRIVPGTTASLEVSLKNTGTSDLTSIGLDIIGLPVSWFIVNSKITALAPNATLTNVISISVPVTEEIGSKTITIRSTSKEGATAEKTVTLSITPPEKPAQNQTVPSGTAPSAASGLTGALIAFASSPTAVGFVLAVVIIAGALFLSRRAKPVRKEQPVPAEPVKREHI